MRRREFIALLGGAAAAWPLAARAQQGKSPVRLGFLPLGSPANAYDRSLVAAFQQGLRGVGLIENRDIILDVAWVSGDPDQAVSDVLRRGAELLVPCGSSASVAAKRQTSTIPIVFLSVGDPIAMGLVESLPRPGRNATGFSDILADLSGKLVDLSRELSKPQTTVDYLWHTAWPDGQNRYRATEEAVQAAGMELRSKGIADIAELDEALVTMKQNGSTTLVVQPSPFTYGHRDGSSPRRCRVDWGRYSRSRSPRGRARSSPMAPTTSTCIAGLRCTWTASLKAPTLPIFQSSNPPRSNCWSICRPPRCWESRCRYLCSSALTS
jgi:putative tryptophan/tyrosine transport system substrate-binding protein